ncbi:putative nucleoporin [Helianthus anomalus]
MLLQWPPLVEVVDSREFPSVLIERYNVVGGEGTALCGIFPEIRRAWAILSVFFHQIITESSTGFSGCKIHSSSIRQNCPCSMNFRKYLWVAGYHMGHFLLLVKD